MLIDFLIFILLFPYLYFSVINAAERRWNIISREDTQSSPTVWNCFPPAASHQMFNSQCIQFSHWTVWVSSLLPRNRWERYIKNTKFEVCRINKNETKLFNFFSCEFFSFLLWEDNMVVAVYLALGVALTTAQSQTSHHSNEWNTTQDFSASAPALHLTIWEVSG